MNVAVVGTGYVGLVPASASPSSDTMLPAWTPDERRIEQIGRGRHRSSRRTSKGCSRGISASG